MSAVPVDILSVAPMIQWTDRYWRYYFRAITKRTLLYTEMVMDNALLYNAHNLEPFLGHDDCEHPLAVQLGGCDAKKLGDAAYLVQQFRTVTEINLNAGCPSNKAKRGGFGAELMLEPEKIREILHTMKRQATNTEITLKCRIGVTGRESFDDLIFLLQNAESAGINKVILHARSCVLHGLSPAQNRTIPPLHPELVHQLTNLFPNLRFVLNGGIVDMDIAQQHLGLLPLNEVQVEAEWTPKVHGVMIGREAYNHPFSFSHADSTFYHTKTDPLPSRREVIERYLDYAEGAIAGNFQGANCCNLVKPLHNVFHHFAHHNVAYKQRLNDQLIACSKAVDRGEMTLSDLVLSVVDETVPRELQEKRGIFSYKCDD